MENCPASGFDAAVFHDAYCRLLNFLDKSGDAKFLLTTSFWKHPADDTIRNLATEFDCPLVELGDLGERDDMMAIGLFAHDGVARHPGDKGMQTIADRIIEKLPL